jgi:glycosyltransferase involved in cell wall biosynthesis
MTRRLRILLAPDWYPTELDPLAGAFVRDQAQALALRHDVTVLFHDESLDGLMPRARVERSEDGEVSVVRISTGRAPGSRLAKLVFVLTARRVLNELQGAERPNLIHAHGFSAAALALAAAGGRIPLVVTEHFTDFLEGLVVGTDARIARYVFRRAAMVCAVSEVLSDALLELEPETRVSLVPNVVDAYPFLAVQRSATVHHPPRLLAVASLDRRKDIASLLDAVALLSRDGTSVRVEIIGDGPLRAELAEQAGRLAGGEIRFLGPQPREAVALAMAEADLLVMSSVVETFGIAAIEAAIAGLPVVATDAVPALDAIGPEFSIAVPVGDPRAIAAAITEVLSGHTMGPGMDRRSELAARFSEAELLRRLDEVYETVLGS